MGNLLADGVGRTLTGLGLQKESTPKSLAGDDTSPRASNWPTVERAPVSKSFGEVSLEDEDFGMGSWAAGNHVHSDGLCSDDDEGNQYRQMLLGLSEDQEDALVSHLMAPATPRGDLTSLAEVAGPLPEIGILSNQANDFGKDLDDLANIAVEITVPLAVGMQELE